MSLTSKNNIGFGKATSTGRNLGLQGGVGGASGRSRSEEGRGERKHCVTECYNDIRIFIASSPFVDPPSHFELSVNDWEAKTCVGSFQYEEPTDENDSEDMIDIRTYPEQDSLGNFRAQMVIRGGMWCYQKTVDGPQDECRDFECCYGANSCSIQINNGEKSYEHRDGDCTQCLCDGLTLTVDINGVPNGSKETDALVEELVEFAEDNAEAYDDAYYFDCAPRGASREQIIECQQNLKQEYADKVRDIINKFKKLSPCGCVK